jgi:rubrerythrin
VSGIGDIRVDGMTRGAFIARSVLAAGALSGAAAAGPALTRALAHAKHGAFSGGDVGIVNFALTLEKVEAEFYKRALAVPGLEPKVKRLLGSIAKAETEHVQSLTQALTGLGGKADPAPQVRFPVLPNQEQVLRVAVELEDTGVYAYNGAATQLDSSDLLQAFASLAQVEARHAGALREVAGQFPTVTPFDRVLSGEQADEALHQLAR